jgi:adenosine deaminase
MVESCESSLEYRRLCTCRRRYQKLRHSDEAKKLFGKNVHGNLGDMLTCFEFFFPLVFDNMELIESLSLDFVKRQYEQRCIYTEVRYSPHLLASDPRKSHEAVTRGLRKGCEKYRITVNQILCAINFYPDWSKDVVEMADGHRKDFPCAVVGIDVASGEDHFSDDSPLRQGHFDMCQKAKELGLNITIHAGETPNSAQNVQKAIEEYGAKRIGHGYRITEHDHIMQLVINKNIHIEVCPTSSVETGGWKKTDWKEHPASIFRDKGISLSFSSDDPAVFNTSLTWQYRIALKKMGWEEDEVMGMLDHAIQAAFVPESKKESLRQEVRDYVVGENHVFADRVHYD